jgi:hypothetical protein
MTLTPTSTYDLDSVKQPLDLLGLFFNKNIKNQVWWCFEKNHQMTMFPLIYFTSEFLSNVKLKNMISTYTKFLNILVRTYISDDLLRNDKGYYTYSSQVGGILLFETQNFNTCIQSWCTFHNGSEKTNAKTLLQTIITHGALHTRKPF